MESIALCSVLNFLTEDKARSSYTRLTAADKLAPNAQQANPRTDTNSLSTQYPSSVSIGHWLWLLLMGLFASSGNLQGQHREGAKLGELFCAVAVGADEEPDSLDESIGELSLASPTRFLRLVPKDGAVALRMRAGPTLDLALARERMTGEPAWRLQHALEEAGVPHWLRISGEVQMRYEGIDGQFRPAPRLDDSDHVLFNRTLLRLDADFESVVITLELQDSRHVGGDRGSALDTSSINAAELLQALMTIRLGRLGNGEHELRLGRLTFDLGSRRLVARNVFRNAINAFTGALWQWTSDDFVLSAFYTLPIDRLPSDIPSVVDNELEFDDEDFDTEFFGAHLKHRLFERHWAEVYFYGLNDDQNGAPEREIYTIGSRLLLAAQPGRFDYSIEAAYQFGDSELVAGAGRMDHHAGLAHAQLGYTFDTSWSPRIVIAFDYVSGDDNPGDSENNRFDTLYGQPFEFGPTGLYTLINRFNLISPVLRFQVKPEPNLTLDLAWRPVWLASDQDIGTTARLQDVTGSSGSFVGNQIDFRLRWEILPKSVRIDVGVVYFARGEFLKDAPGAQGKDTIYQYIQFRWLF